MKIISTLNYASNGIKVLVHGQPGIGKTCLCASLPKPIIISVESGLLSLSELDLPAVEIKDVNDLGEVLGWLEGSKEADAYESVCLDSISEIAEVVLCSPSKIRHDAYMGLITPVKIRPMIFAREAIDEYKVNGTAYQRKRIEEKRNAKVAEGN